LVVLGALGLAYLFEKGWFLWWAGGSLVIAVAVTLYRRWLRRAAATAAVNPGVGPDESLDAGWSPLEQKAWQDVLRIADEVETRPPATVDALRETCTRIVRSVSRRLHPGREFAEAHFTFPDILWAVEKGVGDLRRQVEANVPGVELVRVSDLLSLHEAYRRYGTWGKAIWYAYRLYRMITNPIGAVINESRQWVQDGDANATFDYFKGQVARSVAEELGRLAIDLYAGRLRADAPRLIEQAGESALQEQALPPVTVLVIGQMSAGKSSLVNALLEDVRATVSEVPLRAGASEHRVTTPGRPDLVLIDMPGFGADKKQQEQLIEKASNADLILWVVSAASPARHADRDAMDRLQQAFDADPSKRPPPVLIAATHVDRLRPQREWSPPYDVENPTSLKEQSIRGAIAAIADDLPMATGVVVPVSLRPDDAPYNLDALWAIVSQMLPVARQVALRRILESRRGFDTWRFLGQAGSAGRYLGKKALEALLKKERASLENRGIIPRD
jgi:predicted GTPase